MRKIKKKRSGMNRKNPEERKKGGQCCENKQG